MTFLSEVSEVLGSTLDHRLTLDNLASLVVSYLADWCTICLVEEDGKVDRVSSAHADPGKAELVAQLQQGPPPSARFQPALFEVLESGRSKLVRDATAENVSTVSLDSEQQKLVERIGLGSVLIVPLVSRGAVVGGIFMARGPAGPPFSSLDCELAEELGRRAAVAVDNARLHSQARRLNDELEQRVLERTAELAEANRQLEAQIAERRRAETELQDRERQLTRAQRMTHLGSWAWRPSTGELYWSEETCRIFGYPVDVQPTFDLFLITISPEDRERVRASIEEALERRDTFTFEHGFVRPDGTSGHVRSEGELTLDEHGAVSEVFGTVLDITEARAAQEAVRESEIRFRFLAQNSLHIVALIERDGSIGYMSPSARQVLGHEPHRLVGTNYLDLLHPDDQRTARVDLEKLFLEPGEQYGLSYRYLHGEGEWRVLEILGKLPDQESETAIMNAHDITDRVKADAEIRELNDELRRRSLQLSNTNRELEAFAYSVSHDLRAPLRAIDGFSQALIEDFATQLDPAATGYLTRIRRGAARMGELIDDLLDLSRLSRHSMVREEVDLSSLARDIGGELSRREPARTVEFAVEPGLRTTGDRSLLTLLLQNLLENAWKFTRLKEKAAITVGSRSDGEDTVYFVRDNGAGFDMAYSERLFGAFQRLHSQETFQGTGIGLATVQRIVSRHGGRIWAQGAADEGACFYFTLDQRAYT